MKHCRKRKQFLLNIFISILIWCQLVIQHIKKQVNGTFYQFWLVVSIKIRLHSNSAYYRSLLKRADVELSISECDKKKKIQDASRHSPIMLIVESWQKLWPCAWSLILEILCCEEIFLNYKYEALSIWLTLCLLIMFNVAVLYTEDHDCIWLLGYLSVSWAENCSQIWFIFTVTVRGLLPAPWCIWPSDSDPVWKGLPINSVTSWFHFTALTSAGKAPVTPGWRPHGDCTACKKNSERRGARSEIS